jgi:hypothetical protein
MDAAWSRRYDALKARLSSEKLDLGPLAPAALQLTRR